MTINFKMTDTKADVRRTVPTESPWTPERVKSLATRLNGGKSWGQGAALVEALGETGWSVRPTKMYRWLSGNSLPEGEEIVALDRLEAACADLPLPQQPEPEPDYGWNAARIDALALRLSDGKARGRIGALAVALAKARGLDVSKLVITRWLTGKCPPTRDEAAALDAVEQALDFGPAAGLGKEALRSSWTIERFRAMALFVNEGVLERSARRMFEIADEISARDPNFLPGTRGGSLRSVLTLARKHLTDRRTPTPRVLETLDRFAAAVGFDPENTTVRHNLWNATRLTAMAEFYGDGDGKEGLNRICWILKEQMGQPVGISMLESMARVQQDYAFSMIWQERFSQVAEEIGYRMTDVG